jgi:hypothetical protein
MSGYQGRQVDTLNRGFARPGTGYGGSVPLESGGPGNAPVVTPPAVRSAKIEIRKPNQEGLVIETGGLKSEAKPVKLAFTVPKSSSSGTQGLNPAMFSPQMFQNYNPSPAHQVPVEQNRVVPIQMQITPKAAREQTVNQFSPQLYQAGASPPKMGAGPPIRTASAQPVAPPAETFSKFSLLSFVSSFEDGKSFNETDLATLGLDLQYNEPLLPMLHSVLSDAPLLDHSCHPIPEYYKKVKVGESPEEKIGLFSDETLLFIFSAEPQTKIQLAAAEELQKRGFTFDDETGKWITETGKEWNVYLWKATVASGSV